VVAMVSFDGLPEMIYFFLLMVHFLSSNVCSDLQVYFISGLYWLMKEIGHLHCEPPAWPVMVVSMVRFLGLWEMTYYFVLMVLSFIKHVFWLVIIIYKRTVSIDEINWQFGLWGSRSTCHGGFHSAFSQSPGNDTFWC
jgi:hypothetical protein